jgi:arsenate reductase
MNPRLRILFLCTGNSCRSQMAEGWAKHLKADLIEPYSAGVIAHGMNDYVIRVMREAGVDISAQYSKTVDELPVKDFDFVVTLCDHAAQNCPVLPGRGVKVHMPFDDPPSLALSASTDEEALVPYRRVRDEIRRFIETLPQALTGKAAPPFILRPPLRSEGPRRRNES